MRNLKEMKESLPNYGKDKPYKGKESDFQMSAMRLIRVKYDRFAYHCPNGGTRVKKVNKKTGKTYSPEAQRMRAEGVLSGVSDILIDFPYNGYHGARIELKVHKGRLKDEQVDYLYTMKNRGYFVAVCWSIDGLIEALREYFSKKTC